MPKRKSRDTWHSRLLKGSQRIVLISGMKVKLIGCAIFALSASFAAPSTDNLSDLIARINDAAAKFQSMSANVRYTTYLKVLDDKSDETGAVIMKKVGSDEIAARTEFNPPDKRTVLFKNRTAQVFTPKINTVQIYDLGKQGAQVDRFLMIGFGTSGTELAHDYVMKVLGTDTLDGKGVTRLEMQPTTENLKKLFSRLELWIPDAPAQPYPIQEKIYQESGDYRLVHYLDLKINPSISASALELKLPSGVITQYPQKTQ
jgi:outer membrane lipoprotein-sorting protein